MYVMPNHKSLNSLVRAVRNGEEVTVFQPGLGTVPEDGNVDLEGPHGGKHSWYARGMVQDGKLVAVGPYRPHEVALRRITLQDLQTAPDLPTILDLLRQVQEQYGYNWQDDRVTFHLTLNPFITCKQVKEALDG